MRVSPHLIQKTVELMRQYGFAARLVPAPLVRVGNDIDFMKRIDLFETDGGLDENFVDG